MHKTLTPKFGVTTTLLFLQCSDISRSALNSANIVNICYIARTEALSSDQCLSALILCFSQKLSAAAS